MTHRKGSVTGGPMIRRGRKDAPLADVLAWMTNEARAFTALDHARNKVTITFSCDNTRKGILGLRSISGLGLPEAKIVYDLVCDAKEYEEQKSSDAEKALRGVSSEAAASVSGAAGEENTIKNTGVDEKIQYNELVVGEYCLRSLDTPEHHLAYIRDRIRAATAKNV